MNNVPLKKQSTLTLFMQAEKSFKRSANTLLNFVYASPSLPEEARKAICSGLQTPQQKRKTSCGEIKEAVIHACWEKMSTYPHKKELQKAIADLAEYAFYAQENSHIEMLSFVGKLIYDISSKRTNFLRKSALSLQNSR